MKKCERKSKKINLYRLCASMRKNISMDTYVKVSFLSSKDLMQNLAKLFKTKNVLQFKRSKYLCTLSLGYLK